MMTQNDTMDSVSNQSMPAAKQSWMPLVFTGIVFVIALLLVFKIQFAAVDPGQRTPNKFILPVDFPGKIKITYEVPDAPALNVVDGYRQIVVPVYGMIETSSSLETGYAEDVYMKLQPDGSMTELNSGYIRVHKNGLIGDRDEYFSSAKELEFRDKAMKEAGLVDEDGNNILGNPYELIEIRDDL